MKKITLLVLCVALLSIKGFSQTTQSADSVTSYSIPYDSTQVFVKVDTEALRPQTWSSYIIHNLNASVANNAPVGKYEVRVQFIVTKDGSITDVKALTHFGYGMEEEAVRVIANSPKVPCRTERA